MKASEVGLVGLLHVGNHLLLAAALRLGSQHDRRAMSVVGAELDGPMAPQFLKPHEEVGLDVFDEVPQMDVTIGVGQGGRDKKSSEGWLVHTAGSGGGRRGERASSRQRS